MRKFYLNFIEIAVYNSITSGNKTKLIKRFIGDSTNNNRRLTVSQLIRYLDLIGKDKLADQIVATTEILKNDILKARTNRTDAIDTNELVNTYRNVVINKKKYRQQLGKVFSKRG